MSNFLQRVAAAVIQPPARLRPILGSVFAPAAHRSPEASFPAEVEIASHTLAPHRHQPVATSSFDASNRAGRDRLFPATAPEDLSQSHSSRRLNTDPLLLPAFDAPIELRMAPQAHLSSEGSDPTSETSRPAAANRSVSPASYQPLIAAMQQPAPKLHPREPMPASATIRASRAEAARRSQPTQREPDEVHIHIGRIEVAAIPQQPARPTAAAARRSISLSDYLARNGRSG